MSPLEPHAEGVLLKVRAQPGARRNEVKGVQAEMLKVAVTQVAEKGKANDAIIELLCDTLDLRKSQVTLLAGQTAPRKTLLVRGITLAELQARIDALR
jgi:uncharacterized protein (TIGR00251 family)